MSDPSENVVLEFLGLILADREAGREHELSHYLALFPEHEALVAAEYEALTNEDVTIATPPPGAAEPVAGRLGPYVLQHELGRGGQAVVWSARDSRLGREVALKIMNPGPSVLATETMRRFRREAETASRLDHPGICPVYDIGEEAGVAYIAMRLVEGESLAARIRRENDEGIEATPERAAAILGLIEEVARAAHVAHEAGIVHRDIKPANVMVTPEGKAVVLDFGLAGVEDEDGAPVTMTGDVFGTPVYMAPEQIEPVAGRRPDRRVDVWALGVTLCEALSGRRPFAGPTRAALIKAISEHEPPRLRDVPGVSRRDLRAVVETALSKDLRRRYQTARELADDLAALRAHQVVSVQPDGAARRLARWARREPALAIALGALLLVLTSALIVVSGLLGETTRTLREKNELLDDVQRLSDVKRLAELQAQADELWPAEPDLVPAIRKWIDRARPLIDRIPLHEERLARLRDHALPYGEEQRRIDFAATYARLEEARADEAAVQERLEYDMSDARYDVLEEQLLRLQELIEDLTEEIAKSRTWHFPTYEEQWQHDVLAEMLDELREFATDEHGAVASVERRLRFARDVRRITVEERRSGWDEVLADIAKSRRYGGLRMIAQVGLVPLGPDPDSGLQEFLHLQTHEGEIPERGADGRLPVDEKTGIVFVLIPGGRFLMGAQKRSESEPMFDPMAEELETPPHRITLDPFFLSKYETTQGQWVRFTGNDPSYLRPGIRPIGPHRPTLANPVEQVTWAEVEQMLRRLGLEIPTEAQWEYAARAGTTTPWFTGREHLSLQGYANLADLTAVRYKQTWPALARADEHDDGHVVHSPVGAYRPNAFGLHDMLGNVCEWCRDPVGYYTDPVKEGDAERIVVNTADRIYRGGSFSDAYERLRCSARSFNSKVYRAGVLGFRAGRRLDR